MKKKIIFFVLLLSFISMGDKPNIPQTTSKSAEQWAKEAEESAKKAENSVKKAEEIEKKVDDLNNGFNDKAEKTKSSIEADIKAQIEQTKNEVLDKIKKETNEKIPEFEKKLTEKSDEVVKKFENDMNTTKNELTEKTNSAKEEITQAVTQATTTATEAKTSIEKAKQEIQTATQKINEAKTSAENFSKTATTKAEEATTAANTATQKANEAKADADRAIQTKNESLSIANNVKDDLAKFKDEYTAKLNALDMKTDLALNGSAAAIAIGNLGSISSNSNRQFQLSAAYGFFGGKHAVALGFSGISNNDRFTYRLSGAVTGNGNLAFGAGAGILFGEKRNTNANYEQLKKEIEELRRMINNR